MDLTPTRMPEMMSSDRADLEALLASCVVGHIAFAVDGRPMVLPTAVTRFDDGIVAHGSTGSRWMRALATGVQVAVSVTALDGVIVARSAFESSLLYRSAVIFGSFAPLSGAAKERALEELTERLIPGRTSEVRASSRKEIAATQLLYLPLETWSLRISDGWPEDEADDVASDVWAGVVRYADRTGSIEPAPDLGPGRAVPESARRASLRGHAG